MLRHGSAARRIIAIAVSVNQATQYNIYTAAGSPTGIFDIVVTVNSGIVLQAGLTTGAIPSGCGCQIINNGTIAGPGGTGGNGDSVTSASGETTAGAGSAGGDAIVMNAPLTITNANGLIAGGGGGGGGGGFASNTTSGNWTSSNCGPGGGGGGGRGYNNAGGGSAGTIFGGGPTAGAGTAGSSTAGGPHGAGALATADFAVSGGNGGDGGDWGTAGAAGISGTPDLGGAFGGGGGAGAAGRAVVKNGYALTWISGNDATHVKGAQV